MYLLICLLIIFAIIICILSVSRRKDKKMIKSLQQSTRENTNNNLDVLVQNYCIYLSSSSNKVIVKFISNTGEERIVRKDENKNFGNSSISSSDKLDPYLTKKEAEYYLNYLIAINIVKSKYDT